MITTIISITVLFFVFHILRHSSTIKEIVQTVDVSAVRGYFHCSVDVAQVTSFDKDYPCDFSPQPNPSEVTVVTFINSAWIPIWKNWIHSAEKAGIKDSLFLVGFEPKVCAQVTGIPCYEHPGINIGGTSFAQPGYQKMMIERTHIILKLLSCGRKVALVDADVIFLKNPLTYLDQVVKDKDIVFQADSSGVEMLDSVIPYLVSYICGGFIYMHSNDAVKHLWLAVLQYQSSFQWSDQAGLNICIRHHSQSVRWNILDSKYFPNGRQYFYYNQTNENNLIVHANHLIGNSNKLVRMIAADLWFEVEHGKHICSHPRNFHNYCTPKEDRPVPEWCAKFVNVCRTKFGVDVS